MRAYLKTNMEGQTDMDKIKMESIVMMAQNIGKIEAMFPNCITETVDENGEPKKAINF